MKIYILIKNFKYRLEKVGVDSIIFCYDERIDEYFAMDAKYFIPLELLSKGISEKELKNKCENTNIELLLRGLRHRKLVEEYLK